MNKKGFTLVELLVTIAILGIITGISVPLIRNIQSTQTNKKYGTYLDSVVSGAKLYIDSYAVDLFGHNNEGCRYIEYDQLKEKNLIKDIDMSDVSCDSKYTRVKVIKFYDRYFYKGYLGCGKVKENEVEPTIFKPVKNDSANTCSADVPVSVEFKYEMSSDPDSFDFRQRDLNIRVLSENGFSTTLPLDIKYTVTYGDREPKENQNWNKLSLPGPPSREKQLENMGKRPIELKNSITIPESLEGLTYSGPIYVVLRIDSLYSLGGTKWQPVDSTYYYLGPFTINNAKPTLSEAVANKWVVSTSNVYNTITPKLNLSIKDDSNGKRKFRYCYSYDKEPECPIPSSLKDTENINKYTLYTKDSSKAEMRKISNSYDGSTHVVHLTVIDQAMNYTRVDMEYKVSKQHTLTFDSNGGSSVSAIKKIENETWGDLKNPTKTGQTFVEWNTKADGTGTKVTKDTKVTGDLKVYAKWSVGVYTVSYNGNGATSGTTTATKCTYGQAVTPATNGFAKTGHTFAGWSGIPAKCTGNVTLTATWKANTYKITYNGNGNTSGSTAQTSCSYNANCSLRGNGFVKKGYTFTGWYTAASGGTKYGTTTKLTGNITVYARWRSNFVNIQYHVNGGTWASPHGSDYSISNGYIYRKVNGTKTTKFHQRYYNGSGQADPFNATNSKHINLKKTGKRLTTNAQWKCATSAKCGTKTYNQDSSYSAKNYCSTIESGDCTITLKANWK